MLLEILLGIVIILQVVLVGVIVSQRPRKNLEDIIRRAYREGRQSIMDGICSGTSLDDAYIDEAVEQIRERCAGEKTNE